MKLMKNISKELEREIQNMGESSNCRKLKLFHVYIHLSVDCSLKWVYPRKLTCTCKGFSMQYLNGGNQDNVHAHRWGINMDLS